MDRQTMDVQPKGISQVNCSCMLDLPACGNGIRGLPTGKGWISG